MLRVLRGRTRLSITKTTFDPKWLVSEPVVLSLRFYVYHHIFDEICPLQPLLQFAKPSYHGWFDQARNTCCASPAVWFYRDPRSPAKHVCDIACVSDLIPPCWCKSLLNDSPASFPRANMAAFKPIISLEGLIISRLRSSMSPILKPAPPCVLLERRSYMRTLSMKKPQLQWSLILARLSAGKMVSNTK